MDPVAARPAPILEPIQAPEDIGAARRQVRRMAEAFGATEAQVGRAELIASELASNALHHAQPPGYLILQPIADPDQCGIEILAVDHGPGITDLLRALAGEADASEVRRREPELSSARSAGLGCGLAGVRRLASQFDIYTVPGRGTAILARIFLGKRDSGPRAAIGATSPMTSDQGFAFGVVSLPIATESVNGDGWALWRRGSRCTAFVVDGLGHGPGAFEAAQAAITRFHERPDREIPEIMEAAHLALRSTRGAAASICQIHADQGRVLFAGVGNVEGRLYARAKNTGLAPRNGTLGMTLAYPTMQVREEAWHDDSLLVLHSDGLRHHFDFAKDPGLPARDPALVAAVLHRNLVRGRDDVTVLVVANRRGAA
jgi:anti-sigma regulatory factor (Ser/Thr protein kinase)